MYPNLYYVFKDWFGVEWKNLAFLNTFGLFVALAFVAAAVVLSSELKRKEKLGLLLPREEMITVGKPASMLDIFLNGITGFIFGYKLFGLFFHSFLQTFFFTKSVFGCILANILGNFHTAKMRTAHTAEMRKLRAFSGKCFVMKFPCRFRIKR